MGGDVGTHFCPWSKEGMSALQAAGAPHFLITIWVLFSCPPPHEGLIPLTSTEAPVMYPLSSDAKNATTSATSVGMVGEGQSYFLRYRLAIPSTLHPPPQILNLHQSLIPVRPFQYYYRFKALFKPLPDPFCNPCSPSGSPMCPNGIIAVTCKETLTWVEVSFMDSPPPTYFFIPHYAHVCAQQSLSETSDRLPSTHSLPCPSLSLAFSGSWALQ